MDVQQTVSRLRPTFGEAPRVVRFRAPADPEAAASGEGATAAPDEVAIAIADDCPATGFASYSTLDLTRFPTNVTADDGRPIRTELITVGRVGFRTQADVLARCAFAVAGGSMHVLPNSLIPGAVQVVDDGRTMKHVLLVVPFCWPDLEILVDEDDGVTTWLQAVPISDSEFEFATRSGTDVLFARLEAAGADVSDIDRTPVV